MASQLIRQDAPKPFKRRAELGFDDRWKDCCETLLRSVPSELRESVGLRLHDPRQGGRGLRAWVNLCSKSESRIPERVPDALINVYLRDPDAMPLHDCERCGIPIPVRVIGYDDPLEFEESYFPVCPLCGGRTGLNAFCIRLAESPAVVDRETSVLDRLRRKPK